jgi:outer membrane immunogenic protein
MKQLKFVLVGTALASVLGSAAIAADCSFSGFYMGAQLGAGRTSTEVKFSEPFIPRNPAIPLAEQDKSNENHNLAGTSPIGGLHVGYGKQFPNRFYLGVEAYGNLSNNKSKNSFTDESPGHNNHKSEKNFKSERTNSFGVAVRPGIVFGNALFYVKAGIESANFKYSTSYSSHDDLNGHQSFGGSKNGRRIGFVPGIGVAFNATDRIVLGLEATHTFYKDAKIENIGKRLGIGGNPDGTATNTTKFHSQVTDVFARVSYKW